MIGNDRTDEMIMTANPKLISPCGNYCGVCGVFIATRDNHDKFKEALASVFKGTLPGGENLTAKDIHCEGCLSDQPFYYCKSCPIRDCTRSRGYEGCHQCSDYPCQFIEDFPMTVGKRVILRAIPHRREVGTEQWVLDEEARYHCPECGQGLFRGAKRCNKCRTAVDLD
jgi:hypothetical protein